MSDDGETVLINTSLLPAAFRNGSAQKSGMICL